MTQHKFDKSQFKDVHDVAYELTATEVRMRKRREQIAAIEADNKLDEHRITQLDRWMLAIFEANPDKQCVQICVGYGEYVLTPGEGIVMIYTPKTPSQLTMTPYPIEPDGDVEFDDEFKGSPFVRFNGHHHTEDQACS
jgi:hypothetical protein